MIKDLLITPLDIIETPGGNVMHAMKNDSPGYFGFGEAYFSEIEYKMIKAWKRHREMTLNLVVPHGEVRFILHDDRHVEGPAHEHACDERTDVAKHDNLQKKQ